MLLVVVFPFMFAACTTESAPSSVVVRNTVSESQLNRRSELLKPLAAKLRQEYRNGTWIRVAYTLEGQSASTVEELIGLADATSTDEVTGRHTYYFAPAPVLANIENPDGGDFRIVIHDGRIEEAVSSVLPEY